MNRLLVVAATVLLAVSSAFALEVKVDPAGGAPRITVDGKPVRPRMFWGARGGAPVKVDAGPQVISFEFVPTQDTERATLHLRFGQIPGDIFVDDLRITDLATGKDVLVADFESGESSFTSGWQSWPTGKSNTVGKFTVEPGSGNNGSSGLHVALNQPPAKQWPDFHIYTNPKLSLDSKHRYRASIWIRSTVARDLRMCFYQPADHYIFLGGPEDPFIAQVKLAGEAGANFVSFPIGLSWPPPGKPLDFRAAEIECERILVANPRALLVPRVDMNAPTWWRDAHPDEVMTWEDRSHGQQPKAVPAPPYTSDACRQLELLVKHLESKFGDHIAGYHPCGQNTGEWFYQDTWGQKLNGYAPADTREFRAWLKKRYASDQALQKAWNRIDVTLDTAAVPPAKVRHAAPSGALRDPAKERELLDFNQFQQDLMTSCVLAQAKTLRQATGGKKLVLFFFGYVFEFGAINRGPAVSGHYALRPLLDSPDIDILCSPISYFDRAKGESAPAMTAAESVALANKMWLYEDDTATYLSSGAAPGHKERVSTLEESNQLLIRNTAQEALRNFACWWMDLGASGWFNHPGMWAQMKKLQAVDQPLLDKPTPFRPQVAAVIDPQSMLAVAAGGSVVSRPLVYDCRAPLGRMGAPYGQYLMDDLIAGKVSAKLYVMLNPWLLTSQQRRAISSATRGAVRIWCYAPGYLQETGPSLDAMRELTGFTFKQISAPKPLATPTEAGKRLGLSEPFGPKALVTPLFAVADATADETLATWPDGSCAIAMRQTPSGVSIFVGVPALDPALLRLAAKKAGVHLYTQVNCNVYANGPFVVLHGSQDRDIELDTGKPAPITDVMTGQKIGTGPRITIPLKLGETRVLRVE